MEYRNMQLEEFTNILCAKTPVPGGGGASALCGAIGVSLVGMVCNFTSGKKKFASYEADYAKMLKSTDKIRTQLLKLIDKDAEVFEPLSKAYGLPADTSEQCLYKETILQTSLIQAARVPLEIMEVAANAIELHAELVGKCSAIVISDIGVGVVLCKSALQGASLNVFINTKLIKSETEKVQYESRANELLNKYLVMADDVFSIVRDRLTK